MREFKAVLYKLIHTAVPTAKLHQAECIDNALQRTEQIPHGSLVSYLSLDQPVQTLSNYDHIEFGYKNYSLHTFLYSVTKDSENGSSLSQW